MKVNMRTGGYLLDIICMTTYLTWIGISASNWNNK